MATVRAAPIDPQGSARVIRCLQDNREQLQIECSMALFDQEVRSASATPHLLLANGRHVQLSCVPLGGHAGPYPAFCM